MVKDFFLTCTLSDDLHFDDEALLLWLAGVRRLSELSGADVISRLSDHCCLLH